MIKGRFLLVAGLLLAGGLLAGCPAPQPGEQLHGQVRLTLLHTSDIHSRLFEYDLDISQTDAELGLGAASTVSRIGGVARQSYILGRERARADRVLHIDGGDCFQGAPVFNFFNGEAEMRALSEMGTDVMVVANHEFDKGALNFANQAQKWATFPILAANYKLEDPAKAGNPELGRVLVPWTSFDVEGLRVGVIGMGNLSSITSIFDEPNSLGIYPLNTADVAQFYVDLIRPLVDVVVIVSHLGLDVDEDMIHHTSGIDVVLGGHNHIVLQPPKTIQDCYGDGAGERYICQVSGSPGHDGPTKGDWTHGCPGEYVKRACQPRNVILAHSGAFAKYVGRLDLVLSDAKTDLGYDPKGDGFEVLDHNYQIFPVTEDIPQDPHLYNLLVPYKQGLDALVDLELLVGYAPGGSSRTAPAGGDSALGNMVSTAMWLRQGVQTDFAFTNTTGIRADLVPGPVTLEEVYNVFPFDNAITKMQLSGDEIQRTFDFIARRSASRGCTSQVQIAGARVVLNCEGCTNRPDLIPACDPENAHCPNNVECDKATRRCTPQPCAESIFIGRNEKAKCKSGTVNGKSVTADEVCGGAVGSCDLSQPDAGGNGTCWLPIQNIGSYELATSDYLSAGGSGFSVLRQNTTTFNTYVQQRDALTDYVRQGKPCGYSDKNGTSSGLKACAADADCGDDTLVCACTGNVETHETRLTCTKDADCVGAAVGSCDFSGGKGKPGRCGPVPEHATCDTVSACAAGKGECVLRTCRDDLAAFHRRTCESGRTPGAQEACETQLNPCEIGGETCKYLACVDQRVTNFTDGRQLMVGR